MSIEHALQSQYLAALEMLRQAVVKCPVSQWQAENSKGKYWHIAYHVLYYVHKNLQTSEKDFTPWMCSRAPREAPSASLAEPITGEAYSRDEILAYLEFCKLQIMEKLPGMQLQADSGFPWFPFSKLELQIHSIRHIQHHASQLSERLEKDEVAWVTEVKSWKHA
jgi:hypothetical protein